jgi:type II secretory pathway component GspD/PulD (secretin)
MTLWKALLTFVTIGGPAFLLGDPVHLRTAASPAVAAAAEPVVPAAGSPGPQPEESKAAAPAALPPVVELPASALAARESNPLPAPATVAPLPQVSSPAMDSSGGMSTAGLPDVGADGYWVDNAPLNEVFQYLARKARLQYFFNNEISGPEFMLTGHLELDDPLRQMEDIAVAFGLSLYQQGSTVYMMNEAQLARLPLEVMSYQLKYLRGSSPSGNAGSSSGGAEGAPGVADFEKLKSILRPMLTKTVGQVEFEEKTNTLLVTDNSVRLARVLKLLEKLDKPKPQIAVNVRVLRVTNREGKKLGVDWRTTLGEGVSISAVQSLNAMFNLPETSLLTKASSTVTELADSFDRQTNSSGIVGVVNPPPVENFTSSTTSTGLTTSLNSTSRESVYDDGPGLVFDALQLQAVVRALEENGVVSQESCPTIITEDNEQGIISIVDRFPIVTSNVSQSTAGQTITDEVRYKIDEEDPDAMEEPEKSREIGVTLSVTPTLLPDGTVRMKLRPRVAKIVELVQGSAGNVYPRVSESTAEAISRIPAGQSLILGGFYDYSNTNEKNKVPLLGNIPVLKHLFRHKEKSLEKVSLIFIITPSVYDASSIPALHAVNEEQRTYSGMSRSEIDQLSTRLQPVEVPGEFSGKAAPPAPSLPLEGPAPEPRRRGWLKRMFTGEEREPSSTSRGPQ